MLFESLALLKQNFPESILAEKEFRGERTLHIRLSEIAEICRFLRDSCGFEVLTDLCGADAFTPENRFEVVYNIYSLSTHERLRLKVFVDDSDLHVPTVSGIWPGAEWTERETFDMFGIIFDGHPDLRRMYLPEEFEHFPLRKDFPLMGIPDSLPLPKK
jgi:NADH-quinone oxidoreductase subunit C